jgi:tripartite-type tricarboxylate transporter receptor subunit TctC
MKSRVLRGIALVALATLILAACGQQPTTPSSGGGTPGEFKPTYDGSKLQPLPDGFPNRPITLLNLDDPGSDDGVYARVMQESLQSISPVAVRVLDRPSPTFGTWEGIQFASGQRGGEDGYVAIVGAMTGAALDLLVEPITPQLKMDIDDLNPIIATERVPFVVATRANAPWKTYEEMVTYAKEHPGELRYISRGTGSQLDIAMERLMDEQGWSAKKIPLEDPQAIATTVGAGEGDFAIMLPGVALGHAQAGRIKIILAIGDKAPAPWTDAATTDALGMPDEPWGTLRGLLAPPEVPAQHREWLQELFRAASQTDAYKQRVAALPGAQPVELGHDEIVTSMKDVVSFADPIVRKLGLHYTQHAG